jgi:hypothetical protein
MALAAPQAADRLITLTAASKTFNLAGGSTSETIIADPDLRRRYTDAAKTGHSFEYNLFGRWLAEAAYNEGAPWLDALLPYLAANQARYFAAGYRRGDSRRARRWRRRRPICPGWISPRSTFRGRDRAAHRRGRAHRRQRGRASGSAARATPGSTSLAALRPWTLERLSDADLR